MTKKGFLVKVELSVQKISCPGVWLCTGGKVSLQIHMLDSSVQTRSCKPTFPIQCYEKFTFSKIYYSERRLNELQRTLNNEWFYSELIQWQSCEEGFVLATFQTTLDDLLYPSTYKQSNISGLEIDLLMEPTKLFPGTIAPKLEINTKTTIEEILCDLSDVPQNSRLVTPKGLVSSRTRKDQPRKVCHSIGFSRAQKNIPSINAKNKPIFKYRKPSDDLILRTNPNVVLKEDAVTWKQPEGKDPSTLTCYCRCPSRKSNRRSSSGFINSDKPDLIRNDGPHQDKCSLCSAYEVYFAGEKIQKRNRTDENLSESSRRYPKMCCTCKKHLKQSLLRSREGSDCDQSNMSSCRQCTCRRKEKLSSLAQQLHQKLSRTLDVNTNFFQKCIDCGDVVG